MAGIEVLNQDERHARIGRLVLQQLGEGLEAAGRGANPHDREGPPLLAFVVPRARRATADLRARSDSGPSSLRPLSLGR